MKQDDCDGTEGQDRSDYTDTQDRESYVVAEEAPKRKRGRPKGSKNKPKITIVKNCLDCEKFLNCKLTTKRDNVICEEFVDAFPADEKDDVSFDFVNQEPALTLPLFVCNRATTGCEGCPHSVPHYPKDICNTCEQEMFCEDIQDNCHCVIVKG